MLDLNVQQVYFEAIKNGTKTIEGRLAKEKFRKLKAGDNIRFSNNEGTQSVVRSVAAIHIYPTFEDSFKVQDFKQAVPNVNTIAEAVQIYEQFYTKQMQREYGVVFIELE